VGGFLVRAGIWRGRWVELYRNRKLPALTRNGVLALLPFGLAFVFFSPGMQCGGSHFHEIPWCSSPLAGAALLAGLVCVALGIFVAIVAPAWSKPAWLQAAERANWAGITTETSDRTGYLIGFATIGVLGLGVALVGPGSLRSWAGPVLIGIGLLGGLLARPRRDRPS